MRSARRMGDLCETGYARARCTARTIANPSTAPWGPHGAIAGVTRQCTARQPSSSELEAPKGAGGRSRRRRQARGATSGMRGGGTDRMIGSVPLLPRFFG